MPKPGKSGGVAGAETTRTRILNAAVECLIATGVAGTTTLAVQHRAEVSRGALLHHFPTHASLLAASVAELVRRNERAVSQSRAGLVRQTVWRQPSRRWPSLRVGRRISRSWSYGPSRARIRR